MKKLKFNSGILALIIGGAFAFAGTPVKQSGTLYGKIGGVWTNIEGRDPSTYDCDVQSDKCTARFLSAPNAGGTNYVSGTLVEGMFVE